MRVPTQLLNHPQAPIRRILGILSTVNVWATWVAFTAQPLGLRIRGDESSGILAWVELYLRSPIGQCANIN